MEEKSQLWFACSPFIQVSFWFKQGEGMEKKRKKKKKSRYGNLFRFVYGFFG